MEAGYSKVLNYITILLYHVYHTITQYNNIKSSGKKCRYFDDRSYNGTFFNLKLLSSMIAMMISNNWVIG